MQLRIPGPTPCPEEVLKAMALQMINHRGKEFGELLNDVTARLKRMFQTNNDVFILTGSGTGGMEAAIVNTLSPGDKVLSVSCGVFGNRFSDIAQAFGANVVRIQSEFGTVPDAGEVKKAISSDPTIKAVLITHNETSTGVTCDLETISKIVRSADKLLIVDAISSLGSIDLPVDKWGCDVVATGSQKGWMIPPGLAMVSVSKKAWDAFSKAKMPRFYWDFGKARTFLEKNQTPWTPAVSQFFALKVGLEMIEKEGLQNVFTRHKRVADAARKGAIALGLKLFPQDEAYASNTVTAIKVPESVDGKKLVQTLREDFKVVLSGGQQKLEGKIFRIGHLGWVDEKDIKEVISALKATLPRVGFKGN